MEITLEPIKIKLTIQPDKKSKQRIAEFEKLANLYPEIEITSEDLQELGLQLGFRWQLDALNVRKQGIRGNEG